VHLRRVLFKNQKRVTVADDKSAQRRQVSKALTMAELEKVKFVVTGNHECCGTYTFSITAKGVIRFLHENYGVARETGWDTKGYFLFVRTDKATGSITGYRIIRLSQGLGKDPKRPLQTKLFSQQTSRRSSWVRRYNGAVYRAVLSKSRLKR